MTPSAGFRVKRPHTICIPDSTIAHAETGSSAGLRLKPRYSFREFSPLPLMLIPTGAGILAWRFEFDRCESARASCEGCIGAGRPS